MMEHIQALRERSIALCRSGRLGEAEQTCLQILSLEPANFDAHLMLGALASQSGRTIQAEHHFRRAIDADGTIAPAHVNLGVTLIDLGRPAEAIESFDSAIRLMPQLAVAHWNRGFALYELGRNAEALQSYDVAVALDDSVALYHFRRAEALVELGQLEAAIASCDRALALDPSLAAAHVTRAAALRRCGRHVDALAAADRAIALQPRNAAGHTERGAALFEVGRHAEALPPLQHAASIDPRFAHAHFYMALCLRRMNRLEEALAAWDRTQALQPHSATTLVNRGLVHYELGRFDAALRDYRHALRLAPQAIDARWNASWCLLKLGQFAEGWEFFEARRELPPPGRARNLPKPRWTGCEEIAGRTLLVRAEQGLGDTIQFCRYLKLASGRGAKVIFEAPVELHRLLGGLAGMSALTAPDSTPSEFDIHCDLMSLPRAFGTDLNTIPAEVPYLRSDRGKVSEWKKAMEERRGLRVGLVWSAGVRPNQPELWTYDRRNLPLANLTDWRDLDVEFYSLQKGPTAQAQLSQAIAAHWEGPDIIDCAERLKDFADTAAAIDNLDLVISVDTAVAHLAGALGKPVWILLCADACWRWLLDRVDSPWYPTARLYRQVTPGNWDSVMQQVREDLETLVGIFRLPSFQ